MISFNDKVDQMVLTADPELRAALREMDKEAQESNVSIYEIILSKLYDEYMKTTSVKEWVDNEKII